MVTKIYREDGCMKKFIGGLLIGIIISAATVIFAAEQFTVLRATFPIYINGQEWKTDKLVAVIDGSTYLPVKALGDVLGIKVEWNQDKARVDVGETPTTGYSYFNPAPIGRVQTITVDDLLQKYKVEMSIKEIIRRDDAWEKIRAANIFNDPAPDGCEYILAEIYFKVLDIDEGQAYNLNDINIDMISSDGKEYEYAMVVAPEPTIDANLYKGASNEGWAVYIVKKDDATPKLVFGRNYTGSGGIWFKAY
jgi:hypothetical protein